MDTSVESKLNRLKNMAEAYHQRYKYGNEEVL